MNEVERIVDQYDRVMSGDAWHGDPVWKVLDGITADEAAAVPVVGQHPIWQLVLHMQYWEQQVTARLTGRGAPPDESLNFPAIPEPSETNWQKALADFRASNQCLREALTRLDPARLDEPAVIDRKSHYVEAHGLIQHHLYHAGQISLLRSKRHS